jgi:hypothetical protein
MGDDKEELLLEKAEIKGKGQSLTVPLKKGDFLIFIPDNPISTFSKGVLADNGGSVRITVTLENMNVSHDGSIKGQNIKIAGIMQ